MQGKKVLLVFAAFLCLLPTVTVALFVQQPDSPATKRAPAERKLVIPGDLSGDLAHDCRELLKPIGELQHEHLDALTRGLEADKIWHRLFVLQSDELLGFLQFEYAKCVTELTNVSLRRDAFRAYEALRAEQVLRATRETDASWGRAMEKEQLTVQTMVDAINKRKADFAEAANFAVELFKQVQQYKEAYEDEMHAYDRLSQLNKEVLDLAEKIGYESRGPSWEALVNPPKPQIIRIETPAVPRSLYCTSSTMPPAAPGLETWTWTNCHW